MWCRPDRAGKFFCPRYPGQLPWAIILRPVGAVNGGHRDTAAPTPPLPHSPLTIEQGELEFSERTRHALNHE